MRPACCRVWRARPQRARAGARRPAPARRPGPQADSAAAAPGRTRRRRLKAQLLHEIIAQHQLPGAAIRAAAPAEGGGEGGPGPGPSARWLQHQHSNDPAGMQARIAGLLGLAVQQQPATAGEGQPQQREADARTARAWLAALQGRCEWATWALEQRWAAAAGSAAVLPTLRCSNPRRPGAPAAPASSAPPARPPRCPVSCRICDVAALQQQPAAGQAGQPPPTHFLEALREFLQQLQDPSTLPPADLGVCPVTGCEAGSLHLALAALALLQCSLRQGGGGAGLLGPGSEALARDLLLCALFAPGRLGCRPSEAAALPQLHEAAAGVLAAACEAQGPVPGPGQVGAGRALRLHTPLQLKPVL